MKFRETIGKALGTQRPSKVFIDELSTYKKETAEPIIEEWIWVEGYKGTDDKMRCYGDYQYEMNKQFDIELGTTAKECVNGFHLCLELSDVFDYYAARKKNKFFKVKALVRKEDYDNYGKFETTGMFGMGHYHTKLVARSIIFTEEVLIDELCNAIRVSYAKHLPYDISDKHIKMIYESGLDYALEVYWRDTLVKDGYSEAFAHYLVTHKSASTAEKAHALSTITDMSMDVKVLIIMLEK